jgi:hypothetical protein
MSRYNPQLLRLRNCAPLVLSLRKSDAVDPAINKIYLFLNERERFIVVATTPSDCRAQHNNRAVVRRIIRQANELL